MHADIVTLPIQPGKLEDAVGVFRDEAAAVFKKQPGFKALYVLRGSDPNKLVAIGLWETKADSETYDNSGDNQELNAKTAGFGFVAGHPVIEGYEVAVQA